MNESSVMPAPTRKRRWPKRLLWIVLGLCVILGPIVGIHFYDRWQADRELQEAIAELDAADPDWTLERIEAKRRVVPEEENSARIIVGAYRLLPKRPGDDLEEVFQTPLPLQLLPAHEAKLRSTLQPMAKSLAEARKLTHSPNGRHNLVFSPDFISTLITDQQNCRTIAWLLEMDVWLLVQEGQTEQASHSCRAILNAGRSIGDEPLAVCQMVRMALQSLAVSSLERVLAQAQLPAPALNQQQDCLQQETNQPLFLFGMTGERAGIHQMLINVEAGKISLVQMGADPRKGPTTFWENVSEYFAKAQVKRWHRWRLKYDTRLVEAAKLGEIEKYEALKDLEEELAEMDRAVKENRDKLMVVLSMPGNLKIARAEQREDTRLRCAVAALAAERFRLAQQHWPASLEELVKEKMLSEVPIDLFDGQPLRFRPTADGLVIYSIGPDKKYDGTALDDLSNYNPDNQRLEFRLWNPDRRRQPPLPPRVKPVD